LLQGLTTTSGFLDDGLHCCGPDERFRVLVPDGHVFVDGIDKILEADENTAADALAVEFSKPTLHEVEPA